MQFPRRIEMPYTKQTRLNKSSLLFLLTIALLLATFFIPMPQGARIAADFLIVGAFIFIRRGYIFFSQGAGYFRAGQEEKAMKKLRAAVRAGIGAEYRISVASVFIQRGAVDEGIEILEKTLRENNSVTDTNRAKIALSMGLWVKGDLKKAISLLEDVKESGYADDNLYVNLSTYLLTDNQIDKARKIVKEADEKGVALNAMDDNRGWLDIVSGRWNKAEEKFDRLINEECVTFPEPYVHGAQVAVHKNEPEKAMTYLAWCLARPFSTTSTFKTDYVKSLLAGIQNPATSKTFMKAMEENKNLVAAGLDFEGMEAAASFDGPAFVAPEQKRRLPSKAPASDPTAVTKDDDDRMPDTELDEND